MGRVSKRKIDPEIAVLIDRGYNYEDIDQTIKVSKSTVGTIHKQILIGASGYKKAIDRISKQERFDNLLNILDGVLIKLSGPKMIGTAAFESKSRRGKALAKRQRKLSAL